MSYCNTNENVSVMMESFFNLIRLLLPTIPSFRYPCYHSSLFSCPIQNVRGKKTVPSRAPFLSLHYSNLSQEFHYSFTCTRLIADTANAKQMIEITVCATMDSFAIITTNKTLRIISAKVDNVASEIICSLFISRLTFLSSLVDSPFLGPVRLCNWIIQQACQKVNPCMRFET